VFYSFVYFVHDIMASVPWDDLDLYNLCLEK